jgi:uroporphyrin-III C-methyltransferase / precorrin-2 dehydrogenase / sirohydrochlorin ferrochelatase
MTSFPLFVNVAHASPLVNGGGELAVIKARTLLVRAPRVVLATHELPDGLSDVASRIDLLPRAPTLDDIKGRSFVISATGDDVEDARIFALARSLGVPVNVPDRPELCTFALGAFVERGDVTVAISTDGAAPVLATHLREWLERELHPRLGRVAAIAREYRQQVKQLPAGAPRRAFWHEVLTGSVATLIQRGEEAEARRLIEALLAGAKAAVPRGRVIIVGAGPGDPDLLTLKAVRALKSADVIFYDSLVGRGVLEHARREAVVVDVGKRAGKPSAKQGDINAQMIAHARAGKVVVRLKGGDAFVFGRAAEEIAAVEAAGFAVEIVSGITAVQASAVDARLPLTYRGAVRSLSLVAGASIDGDPDLDWDALARPGQAFAIYMGVNTVGRIVRNLLDAGAVASTPVVIVENASRPERRTIATALRDLDAAVEVLKVAGPAILLVGLDWNAAGLTEPSHVERFSAARPLRRAGHASPTLVPLDQFALSL